MTKEEYLNIANERSGFNKHNGIIRSVLIVNGVLGLECRGLIFLQLSQVITSNGHKK